MLKEEKDKINHLKESKFNISRFSRFYFSRFNKFKILLKTSNNTFVVFSTLKGWGDFNFEKLKSFGGRVSLQHIRGGGGGGGGPK